MATRFNTSAWQSLDPRRSLAVAIGWAVFVVVTLTAALGAALSARHAEQQIRTDTEQLLRQYASRIYTSIQLSLQTRRSIIRASALQIAASTDRGDEALTRHLEAVHREFPEFVWLGVADDRAQLIASVGERAEAGGIAAQPWFQAGRRDLYMGATAATSPTAGEIVDVGVPLRFADGRVVGVVGATLSRAWLRGVTQRLEHALDATHDVQVWLLDTDGQVLIGPEAQPVPTATNRTDFTEGGRMLVGRHAGDPHGNGAAAWQVVVREDAASALASARATRDAVFLTTLLSGVIAALAAAIAAHGLLGRLRRLSTQAFAIQRGERLQLDRPSGHDEVAQIGGTLATTVDQLQREKQALTRLNAELDTRVTKRTARIERMAEEARHAAVARERLHMARELHDTLAHSLMALLAQLRLIRRLRGRLPSDELDAELQRAEAVAASGVDEARAAIARMRGNSVSEAGLGPALAELLDRFGQRTGLRTRFASDRTAGALAGERAEVAFRMVEEALRNVERHAGATTVGVHLASAPTAAPDADPGAAPRIRLEVSDDGVGFDPNLRPPGHYGLRGIREQAELIEGRLEVSSTAGAGTRLTLEFTA
ncbi:MAG: hypothetical protein IT522_15230 [Burkholderiales bacterium]|nr:hypothetical protein [Burkholderiales bacterium]